MTERHRQPHAQVPPSPAVSQTERDTREAARSLQHEAEQVAEQVKGKAEMLGKEAQEQVRVAARTVREELAFIRQKFMGSSLKDHVLQLGAALVVATVMHLALNALSHRTSFSTQMFAMYLQHWQPWSFLAGSTLLSRAVDHLPIPEQYAWSVTAMCWLTAIVGWSSFPFTGVLEKAAASLPLNARNFIWLAALSPAINWTVRKIKARA